MTHRFFLPSQLFTSISLFESILSKDPFCVPISVQSLGTRSDIFTLHQSTDLKKDFSWISYMLVKKLSERRMKVEGVHEWECDWNFQLAMHELSKLLCIRYQSIYLWNPKPPSEGSVEDFPKKASSRIFRIKLLSFLKLSSLETPQFAFNPPHLSPTDFCAK